MKTKIYILVLACIALMGFLNAQGPAHTFAPSIPAAGSPHCP